MLPVSGRSPPRLPATGTAEAKMPARILIVDNHLIARTSIRSLVDGHPFRICGEARNGKEAIEKVVELKPDIILSDVSLRRLSIGINSVSA
jgi:two-component system response regulator NreC